MHRVKQKKINKKDIMIFKKKSIRYLQKKQNKTSQQKVIVKVVEQSDGCGDK